MTKYHFWLIPLGVFGLQTSLQAQDIAAIESELVELQLVEAASSQRQVIISGLESMRPLSDYDPLYTTEDTILYNRMRSTQQTIPLALNAQVRPYIQRYTSRNYLPYMSKLQGLAAYYFPIYEKILAENNLPDEIKYISVIESSLNPHLVSRAGAVGLWQFMYPTAKVYDLTIDAYMDERKDPYAACYAASRYFMDAYREFNDWLLALASYNCGQGGVRRAIRRSGIENPSFWQVAPYLPKETRDYIPKFIAMSYVLRNAAHYGIGTTPSEFVWEGQAIMVDKPVDLKQISRAVNLPLEVVKQFNPAYKRTTIQASAESPKRLILPQTDALSESVLYAALHNELAESESLLAEADVTVPKKTKSIKHLVKRGESLEAIAKQYGIEVRDIQAWNGLSATSEIEGRTILLLKKEEIADTRLAKVAEPKKVAVKANERKRPSETFVSYRVRKGDTLSHIAARFKGARVSQIKADNALHNSRLRIGQRLKIRKK